MRTAIISGTFDPVTVGHLDVIQRASALFGKVVVAVSASHYKDSFLPAEVRKAALEACTADISGVSVELPTGVLADFCRRFDDPVIVRGARGCADFEYEYSMYCINKSISGVDTVILPADARLAHISSSYAREMAKYGKSLAGIVPDKAIEVIENRL